MSEEFMYRMLESYDRVHNDRYWNEVESIITDLQGKTVMDLGCGPGLLLKDIAERYNPAKLIGIDLSDIMLDRAKQELSKFQDIEINLIQQHLQDNPALPAKADAIFTSRVLRSFEQQDVTINSIHNSLTDDGYLVILDWDKADIITYEKWFNRDTNDFDDLTPGEVIKYHRNFSQYNINDWRYILTNFGFDICHSFQLDVVHVGIIAQKQ